MVGNRIVIEVEADIRCLAGADGADDVTVEGVLRSRQKKRALLVESVFDQSLLRIARDGALVRDGFNPYFQLTIEILDGGEAPRREECVTEILDRALDLALFIAARGRARVRREMIVTAQLEQRLAVADVIADPLDDGALEVIVEYATWNAGKRVERAHVSAQEALGGLVKKEARVHRPRPTEHHNETGQGAIGVTDFDSTEIPPIDLGLLARQRPQSEGRPR